MKRQLVFFCSLAIAGNLFCQQSDPTVIEFSKKDLQATPSTLSAVADRISFVKLETTKEALIGGSNMYYCTMIQNGFLIYPAQGKEDMLLFDLSGKFMTKVGHIGEGPGEYSQYYRAKYDAVNDHIIVYRPFGNSLLLFSAAGKYLETITLALGDVRPDHVMIIDKNCLWFTYEKPLDGELNEIGVIKTDLSGKLIKKYDLTDKNVPGCYGSSPQRNQLYRSGNETLFSYYPYSKTLRLSAEDTWKPAYQINSPFPEGPIELYYRNAIMKQSEFGRENGLITNARIFPGYIKIEGATPMMFNLLIDRKTGIRHIWGFDMVLKDSGLKDDLAGGPMVDIRTLDSNNNSVSMVDASKLLEMKEKGLLGKEFQDKAAHQELMTIIKKTKEDDNPVIRIVHLK
jgi:hypothetical protein